VRDLFAEARKRAPAIVFIDEIDAIGARRGGALVSNDEREQTLNQLLAEMDGFDASVGVVVIAATNRPETLDPALLRPAGSTGQVEIPLPNLKERAAILAVHATGKQLGPDVDLLVVARGTPGFSGADLANLLNEAAIVAVRAHRDHGHGRRLRRGQGPDPPRAPGCLERPAPGGETSRGGARGRPRPRGGPLRARGSGVEGHDPSAGQALGVTQQLPVDERHLYPESYLQDSLAIRMGGRAAEHLVIGEVSTGASNDLAGATQLATRMVMEFGMSPKLGPVGFAGRRSRLPRQQEIRSRQYAEATQRVIDQEVERLLKEADDRATALLSGHREALDRVMTLLLERETIDGSDVMAAAGKGPEREDAPEALGDALAHRAEGRA
jgi:cell division protease FtsH